MSNLSNALKASSRIKALLIDLSGTLHVGPKALPGAVRAIERLREHNFPFRFCSNTSKESTADLLSSLKNAGFTIHPHEVFTSLGAMRELLKHRQIKHPYFILSPSAETDFSEYLKSSKSTTPHDAVVVGLAYEKFNYENLNTAFRILSTTEPAQRIPLFATHRARYVRSSSGELSLGPGPFVSALETAVGDGLKAEVVGKPEKTFFEVCLRSLKAKGYSDESEEADIAVEEVAIVGDDCEADLGGGAVELGLKRILVRTGKYREGDEDKTSPRVSDVYDTFGDLVDYVLSQL